MTITRTALIIFLVALLAINVAAANTAVAADRTVLNAEFVTTTFDELGAYELAEPVVLNMLAEAELAEQEGESPAAAIDPEAIMTGAVTAGVLDTEYLQSQFEPTIEHTYAYLHGDTDELEATVDLVPVKAAMGDAIATELRAIEAEELLRMVADEDDSLSIEQGDVSIDLLQAARMARSETTYAQERETFRAGVREHVIDEFAQQAYDEATNDERLALVIEDYDPSAYTTAEKEALVTEHDGEIRAAVRDRIESGDDGEIAAAVDEQLSDTRSTLRTEAEGTFDERFGQMDPAVAEPAKALVRVAIDGYVADVSHDEYNTAFDAATDNLATGMAMLVQHELNEGVPDRVDVADELDPVAAEDLEAARSGVVLIDRLALVLPLVSLGLVGALYHVTRTVAVTAIGAGTGLVVGGLPGLVGTVAIRGPIRELLATPELPSAVADFGVLLIDRVAAVVAYQSAGIIGVGVVLVGIGAAVYLELIDGDLITTDP